MGRAGRLLVLVAALASAACDDELLDPSWVAAADTAVLYSLARPELQLESAFNLIERRTVAIEQPAAATQWDIALDTRAAQLVLLTPNALGITSRARIAALPGQSFDLVVEAPADTLLYTATNPVPLQLTATYVVRTDSRSTSIGGGCSYYAKLQPLTIDVPTGRLQFKYETNPFCNDRRLVPPDTT
jgi:hypothetical protein